MDNLSENTGLSEKLKSGDKDAFEKVFRLHGEALMCFLYKYTGDKELSSDLAQETFIKLWDNKGSINSSRNLKNYLFTIAINLFKDQKRKDKKITNLSLHQLNESGYEPKDKSQDQVKKLTDKELIKIVQTKVEQLPEKDRAIFIMKKVNNMKYDEIADIYSESARNIKRRVRKTIDRLLAELGSLGYDKEGVRLWALL